MNHYATAERYPDEVLSQTFSTGQKATETTFMAIDVEERSWPQGRTGAKLWLKRNGTLN